jgi:uncharacterized protein (TIGR02596 family)
MYKKRRCIPPNSFTLVELLVVMAIIVILIAITVPAFFNMMRTSSLTTGGNRLVDQLNICRQLAMTKNCQVEFRFYQLPDANAPVASAPSVFRAFQGFSLDNGGSQTNAITKVMYLPSQIYIAANTTASTLLSTNNPPYYVAGTSPTTAGNSVGVYPPASYNYLDFHFKADGSTDLTPTFASPWYVSLANQHDKIQNAASGLPANFITVQIDANTGRARYFRPN